MRIANTMNSQIIVKLCHSNIIHNNNDTWLPTCNLRLNKRPSGCSVMLFILEGLSRAIR